MILPMIDLGASTTSVLPIPCDWQMLWMTICADPGSALITSFTMTIARSTASVDPEIVISLA